MIEVKGKANIVARTLADSISEQGIRLTTWEVEYPRIIHAELMAHRMFSRNAASSRAIPFAKMVEQLNGRPVRFGKNQSGMQDAGEDFEEPVGVIGDEGNTHLLTAEQAWNYAKAEAVNVASSFAEAGYHKQITGRLTEPFQMMKTIISATEVDNFFWLRDDEAADPTIAELARVMKEAQEKSCPVLLRAGQYHLPYIAYLGGYEKGFKYYEDLPEYHVDGYLLSGLKNEVSLEQAIKISCARCAAVSYRNEGYGLEKSLAVYERLLGSDKKHASAFEHVATPAKECEYAVMRILNDNPAKDIANSVNVPYAPQTWERGISHVDREGNLWSGNFKGWIQYRKTIDGENYSGLDNA